MRKIFPVLTFLIVVWFDISAQKIEKISMIWETRYDLIDFGNEQNRLQASLRIPFQIDIAGAFNINGLTSTGSSFQSRWETLKDLKKKEENRKFNLNLRQFYLEKKISDFRVQFGALPAIKGFVSSTGLGSNGWMDGLRLDQKTGIGTFEVAGGSINEINNPNFFDRVFVSNFFEFEFSGTFIPNSVIEFSYEKLGSSDYLRSEYRYDLIKGSKKHLEFAIEGLYNTQRESLSFGFTVTTAPLAFIEEDLAKYMDLKVYFNHTDSNIGLRGILTDDFYKFGNSVTIEAKGTITSRKAVSWFLESYISEVPRFLAGLRFDIE
ncbi:MAG: hypothetical protein J0L60_03780 [Ignavibacteria bacterium]|nr:hypothetical protein [Ignavibacteria bacterium]